MLSTTNCRSALKLVDHYRMRGVDKHRVQYKVQSLRNDELHTHQLRSLAHSISLNFLFISQEILEQEMSIVRSQLKQTTDRSDELEKVIAKCKKLRFCLTCHSCTVLYCTVL